MANRWEPRLLVEWDDEFAHARPREEAPAAEKLASEWAPTLLVDWQDPFAHTQRSWSYAGPPIPIESDLRLMVNWSDELAESRRRETAMAAGIAHLLVILFLLFSPRFLSQKPRSAEEEEEKIRSALSLLYIPPELMQKPQTPPDLTPEERRRAAVRTPFTVDPREIERALPPPPPVTLPPGGGGGAPGLPGEDDRTSPGRERTERPREVVRLEDIPRPQDGQSSALGLPSVRPGRAIEESLRRSQGGGGVPGDLGGPIHPNLNTPFPVILSDTRGVDFGPYLVRLLHKVRRNWYAVMPESAHLGEQGRVVIVFTILKDGAVPSGQPTVVATSGRSHLDRPALASITASQPFPPLPDEFTGDHIVLQFTFLYNLPIDYGGP
ncbi:MAG: TonB family protein [Acidobacteria bacterium]|nr:TonB family protein [Acidobacteriota bacterium]